MSKSHWEENIFDPDGHVVTQERFDGLWNALVQAEADLKAWRRVCTSRHGSQDLCYPASIPIAKPMPPKGIDHG